MKYSLLLTALLAACDNAPPVNAPTQDVQLMDNEPLWDLAAQRREILAIEQAEKVRAKREADVEFFKAIERMQ
jgi:hypothetical protein